MDPIMEECAGCEGTGKREYIHAFGNAGYYAAREARTGDPGPDIRECECEDCGGSGEVEHRCPNCGEPHEAECCEVCDGCESCCACTVCSECKCKVADGGDWEQWEDRPWCRACVEAAYGPWCRETERPCGECPLGDCPDAACAHRDAKEREAAERAAEEA